MKEKVIDSAVVKDAETVNQEGDITINKVYTFRKLQSTDMFLMFRIISKIGINEFTGCFEKDSIKQMLGKISGGNKAIDNAAAVVGISVIFEISNVILGNIHKCESEIYQMLANTSDLSVEQVKELDMITFAEMVIDFIKKDEFKDFIKVVLKSFKPMK